MKNICEKGALKTAPRIKYESIRTQIEMAVAAVRTLNKCVQHLPACVDGFRKDLKLESFDISATKWSWDKSWETFFNSFSLISTIINFAPSSENFLEIPLPNPDAAPVITAILFFNLTNLYFLNILVNFR